MEGKKERKGFFGIRFKKVPLSTLMTTLMITVLFIGVYQALSSIEEIKRLEASVYGLENRVIELEKASLLMARTPPVQMISKEDCAENMLFYGFLDEQSELTKKALQNLGLKFRTICTPTLKLSSWLVCDDQFLKGEKKLIELATFVCVLRKCEDVNAIIQEACEDLNADVCDENYLKEKVKEVRRDLERKGIEIPEDRDVLTGKYGVRLLPTIIFRCRYKRVGGISSLSLEEKELRLVTCLIEEGPKCIS